jgi:hypothetical protein
MRSLVAFIAGNWTVLLPICAAFTAPILSAIIFVIVGKRIDARQNKALENHKSQIQQKVEVEKLKFQSDLQRQLYEYQTKFSSLHTQQAEVLHQLYGKLDETKEILGYLVHPVQTHDLTEHAKLSRETYNDLAKFYVHNSLFLDEETDAKVDMVLKKMKAVIFNWEHAQNPDLPPSKQKLDLWNEAWQSIDKEVPVLLADLKRQFRQKLTP